MSLDLGDNWGTAAAGAGAAVVGAVLYWKKILTSFAREDVMTGRAEAELDIIETLRAELDRLSKQNGMLAEQLIRLQATAMELQASVNTSRLENRELRDEIHSLRDEITRLSAPGGPVPPGPTQES